MSIKKISLLSVIFFFNLFVGQAALANANAPTFIITRNTSLTPNANINLPALSSISVYFNVTNNSPQTFPGILVENLPAGVSFTTNSNTTCVKNGSFAAGSTCVLGLTVVGITEGDDFYIIPQVCESTGTYCSQPDSSNYIHITVTSGGGGGSEVISTVENAALVVASSPSSKEGTNFLSSPGVTNITVNNLGSGTATNVTMLTSVLPADYRDNITVSYTGCASIAPSGSCTITINTDANSSAAAESATTIIFGTNTNFTEITLWMGALTVQADGSQKFQFPSLILSQSTAYQTAISGSIDFDNLTFDTDVSDFVEWCPSTGGSGCGSNLSTCVVSSAMGNSCSIVTQALLPTDEDFTVVTFDTELALSESSGVTYAYSSPTDYTLGLYAGTFDQGLQYWNGSTWQTLLDGNLSDPVLFLNAALWEGDLYIGGSFTNLEGVPGATSIATYNGFGINQVGGGVGGATGGQVAAVAPMVDYQGDLLVGGRFSYTDAAGAQDTAHNIAVWNGSTWSTLGGGVGGSGSTDTVFGLLVDGVDVYAGGSFSVVNNMTDDANNIAFWNDGAVEWEIVGTGVNPGSGASGPVRSIIPCLTAVCVSGNFGYVNSGTSGIGVQANSVGIFDPASVQWGKIGTGLSGAGLGTGLSPVTNLVNFGGDLFGVGSFTTAGNSTPLSVNNVAFFNVGTNSWNAAGTGLTGGTNTGGNYSLVWNNKVYVLGCFTTAGGVAAQGAAVWDGSAWAALGSGIAQGSCTVPDIEQAAAGMLAASTLVFN